MSIPLKMIEQGDIISGLSGQHRLVIKVMSKLIHYRVVKVGQDRRSGVSPVGTERMVNRNTFAEWAHRIVFYEESDKIEAGEKMASRPKPCATTI